MEKAQTLITDEYRALQSELHAREESYGCASVRYARYVAEFLKLSGAREILDYGCGKGRLADALFETRAFSSLIYQGYDPALPEFSAAPRPFQFVACIDVLEHIEPDKLDAVLDHIHTCTINYAFITVHTGPAVKYLADGRNAHLIQQPLEWWARKLERYFTPILSGNMLGGVVLYVKPL